MPFMQNTEVGVPQRVSATGTISFGTGKLGLVGVLIGSMTGPTLQFYHGGAVATSATIIGNITCAANAFTRIPVYASGGVTAVITGAESTVDLTIYWNPLG